jgi:hypothetical protein
MRSIWERCGHLVRGGLGSWRPYETLDLSAQLRLLEVTAVAIRMIETRELAAHGPRQGCFCPSRRGTAWTVGSAERRERRSPLGNGRQRRPRRLSPGQAQPQGRPRIIRCDSVRADRRRSRSSGPRTAAGGGYPRGVLVTYSWPQDYPCSAAPVGRQCGSGQMFAGCWQIIWIRGPGYCQLMCADNGDVCGSDRGCLRATTTTQAFL